MERDFAPRTLAAPVGEVLAVECGGQSLSAERRDELLKEVRAGRPPARLTFTAKTFIQSEQANRNFVRLKPSALRKIAKTFEGVPFLRDHEQRDLSARGGKVLKSDFVGGEGLGHIEQTIELVKPWAIEGVLDGTIDRFSIGWNNTAPVLCSICETPFVASLFGAMSSCQHQPGDEVEMRDGSKRTVEMLVTGADGVEVSAVSVPAVMGTGINEIRSALAAERVRARIAHKENPMKLITQKLGLAEGADEATILAAIDKVRLDGEAAKSLHAAELAAHANTKAALAEFQKAARESTLASLRDAVERKLGKGDNAKPVISVVEQLAEVSLEQAQAYVSRLAQVIPIGAPSIVRNSEPDAQPGELSAQQKSVAKQLGLTNEQYAAQLAADKEVA